MLFVKLSTRPDSYVYPSIGKSWEQHWDHIVPFFKHPEEIRKVIYTTNAIESLNYSLRKVTKARGAFCSDEAMLKLIWLAMQNISKKWTRPVFDWKQALNRFMILHLNTDFTILASLRH